MNLKRRPLLLCGMMMAVLCNIPYVANLMLVWLILGGALAAHLTWKRDGGGMTMGYGGMMGFLAGLLAVPFDIFIVLLSFDPETMSRETHKMISEFPSEFHGAISSSMNMLSNPVGASLASGYALFMMTSIFSTIGGMIVGHKRRSAIVARGVQVHENKGDLPSDDRRSDEEPPRYPDDFSI